ncbi:MAG TPA: hypothetical protein PLE35_00090 [Lentisphaeria bacterium]|nr:hypothetical protein [Lentisphaeria bacterium]
MDEQSKLRLHIELFDAEESLRKMEEARRQCIEAWNRDLREARRIVEAKRNEVRTGCIQPELFDMLKGKE